jgi:hypothetical protein
MNTDSSDSDDSINENNYEKFFNAKKENPFLYNGSNIKLRDFAFRFL